MAWENLELSGVHLSQVNFYIILTQIVSHDEKVIAVYNFNEWLIEGFH